MTLNQNDDFYIAEKAFKSRLIVEITGFDQTMLTNLLNASQSEIVTHTQIQSLDKPKSKDGLHCENVPNHITYIPNTHGCKTADEAVALARLIRKAGLSDWIKLEVSPYNTHYMSDGVETLKAADILVKEGFKVLPYIHADPVLAKRLQEVGCSTVMPLGSPIGSGKGLITKEFIEMIIEEANVPVIVDAGIGKPSHATEAMQIGADAVIVHTAIIYAENPILQAQAFKTAVQAGRASFLAKGDYSKYKENNPKIST
ncbi:HisA/HisF-related TIM barrel protein [Tenacibaculum tangerinum]|uniref:thiazole synthase n=1 Tax=Tenacibaculum tangerinum TaxID=3038772 RepID=A0ABY8L5X2_9FLAO|nr:HisA/HisF-related TIM barrel protein [Tenacibaculum tangerinum]WGH76795.1 HisA/HisF-related TIM barrel protein [Tenacibaculum tangerinum]